MEIPLVIKRRYNELEKHCDKLILDEISRFLIEPYNPYNKDSFIFNVCRGISYWFAFTYGNLTEKYVYEHIKYFVYMFRTKLSVFWENYHLNK